MATRYRFVDLAAAELEEATAYYHAEANIGLAFVDEIERVLGLAMQFPESGTLVPQKRVHREIRLYRLNPDFPYDIVAALIEEEDHLLVLAVAHHKRKSRYWMSRATRAR